MGTLYLRSADGKLVGAFRGKGGRTPEIPGMLAQLGWVQINQGEFRQLKAKILREMVTPESRRTNGDAATEGNGAGHRPA
jgi:hypothetical protein